MQRILLTLTGLVLLFLFWLFRPGPDPVDFTVPAELPVLPYGAEQIDNEIHRSELEAGPLKADNHARIIWNPEFRNRKAPCSIIYIHGFSASYGEGSPLHTQVAQAMGCHLYVSRLHGHGLRTDEPLSDMDPGEILEDAGKAVAIGNILGEEVILMGTSMGGMLSIHLASDYPESVDVLVLFAPLIEFASRSSVLFDRSWGQRIMRLLMGGPLIRFEPDSDDHRRYWYTQYRTESLGVLKTMKRELLSGPVYEQITQPVFAGYYFEDDDEQDEVVSVAAIREIRDRFGTPPEQREFHAFTRADDHVISSSYRTKGYKEVRDVLIPFLEKHTSIALPTGGNL